MNILVIAPHRDDEVIGVGGTIAKYVASGNSVYVCIITHGIEPLCRYDLDEKIREECVMADKFLGVAETIFLDYPASMLETVPRHELNDSLIKIVQKVKPDIVYIPHRGDMQVDHKLTADAAMVALRPKYQHVVKKIYVYETLSETGWDVPNTVNEFIPNSYNEIVEVLDMKIEALSMFTTQIAKYPNPRSAEAIRALAMYRGSNVNLRAAEAFSLIREIEIK
ncbi:MAG: PIG-L family deacetylase [Clostridiales bacterium]|nr:PIG-L family deacetylase [Clostridiales bacterium]